MTNISLPVAVFTDEYPVMTFDYMNDMIASFLKQYIKYRVISNPFSDCYFIPNQKSVQLTWLDN